MSDDPEQEYFSDGITQDIITELGRFGLIDVVAQSSTFVYRDHVTDFSEAGNALGARYLVQGSIRRALDRIRLTVQLIDARTGKQIWGDRFDRKLDDIFAIQDQLVHQIVATLAGRLEDSDTERAIRRQPGSLAAYDCYLKSQHSIRWHDAHHIADGLKLAREAVTLDPSFARGHAILAICLIQSDWFKDAEDQDHFDEALNIAQRAIELDPDDGACHEALGFVYLLHREHERARYHIERALALNPHDIWIWGTHAYYLTSVGKHEAALDRLIEKDTIEPFPTNSHWEDRGSALYGLGRYAEATASFEHMTHLNYWNHAQLASCFGQLGNVERARAHWAKVLEVVPNATLSITGEESSYKYQADVDRWADGLRKANLDDQDS